jgi:hypothetical protein
MFCYFPNKWFGEEKVAWVTGISWSEGDFFLIDGEYALILGEDITAHELIVGQATAVHTELVEKQLCGKETMRLIHAFVAQRYTSYTNTVPLWIGSDMLALMKRRPKSPKPLGRARSLELSSTGKFVFSAAELKTSQQLVVFPDLRTMHQQLPARLFEQAWVARRHSGATALQKAAIFRWCKQGTIHTLITTPAGIYQDRKKLDHIFVVDAHKRWYKSVQDPRYRTPQVLSAMQEIYSCKISTSGVLLEPTV